MKTYEESLLTYARSSRASYLAALNRFKEFCNHAYDGRTQEQIVAELKSISLEQRDDMRTSLAFCKVISTGC
jgi:hypothetical protein